MAGVTTAEARNQARTDILDTLRDQSAQLLANMSRTTGVAPKAHEDKTDARVEPDDQALADINTRVVAAQEKEADAEFAGVIQFPEPAVPKLPRGALASNVGNLSEAVAEA